MSTDSPAEPSATTEPTQPAKQPAKQQGKQPESAVKFTRTAALWTALITGFLVLVLLLVFIIQNGDEVPIRLFAWQWRVQLGVAILLGAVAGGLLTFGVASIRLLQLRLAARKNLKAGSS
ncbi:lipopolysaccharide assembly LapA domain-containing protein [Mycobacterium sp. MAA66]|uniref:LapA family protein n=1 Tax=Mycobacterium sp. MAA66 TaxID=3156297 RepID=UPI0035164732